jgi:hypothetical protein
MRTTNIVQKSQSDREVGTSAIAMTIDEASSVFLMDALGKLYSRPAQAVLREYLSNAIDAHKAKGGKLPAIQITLPEGNTRNPSGSSMLIIRDFGKGMNEEEFGSILSRYGASTKRDSNAMIGGFGLGAKSGFAVSDEFFMTSYQQGRGLRVRIFKDALNQGYIDVIDRFTSNEPDGVRVEVPIPNSNIPELSKRSLFTEFPFFMGYGMDAIDVRPVADYAGQSVHNPKSFSALKLGATTVGWLNNKSSVVTTYALVGKVAYTIDMHHIGEHAKQKNDKDLAAAVKLLTSFRRLKVLDIPIGSVDMPSAREEITYSERSLKTITAVVSNYALILKQHIQKELNSKKTRLQVVKFLAELEADGYSDFSGLSWKGQSFDGSLFKDSEAVVITFSKGSYNDGLTTASASKLKRFRDLLKLSEKSDNKFGIHLITVDSVANISATRKLVTESNIKKFLKLDAASTIYRSNNSALFIIMPKEDVLSEWLFSNSPLEVSTLEQIVVEEKKAKEAEAEKRKIESLKKEEARKKAQKAKETRAQSMLSNFIINDSTGRAVSRNTIDNVFSDEGSKKFYWSEEEVTEFANVTKGLQKIGSGPERTGLLFPFIATPVANTFNSVVERKNWSEINYMNRLRSFLKLFFDKGTKMIVLGKAWDLNEFKATYPDVQSGVLLVKEAIEAQLADEHSAIMIAYNAIGDAKWKDKTEVKNLLSFVGALDETQEAELNEELKSAVERFKVVMTSSSINGLDEKYFLEVLKGFATLASIKEKSYSVGQDTSTLVEKYPLLMNGSFKTYSPEVVSHLIDYINMCDSKK